MPALYTGPYTINPLELPANQTAASLVPAAIVDQSGATWSSSPYRTPNWGNQRPVTAPTSPCCSTSVTVPDATVADRTVCAQAALAAEQLRLQNFQNNLNRNIALITATP